MTANSQDYDHLFKLLIIGDSFTGKSSILLRFTDDEFEEDRACTIGVDFKMKKITVDDKRINLTIWDTAGQEKFRSLTSSYYRGTQGIILVYDVTNTDSFKHLNVWLDEIKNYCMNENVVKLLVGNKIDKENERVVSKQEATEYARSKGMVYLECSAKTTTGIQQAFEETVHKILDNRSLWEKPNASLKVTEQAQEGYGGCASYC
eukprot:TRINITY_DN8879_c0_g1_i1.p1 TRINITY_DN8879_c0_g1~~TRINITY_DN8879_c0_g1_i1.p1  ORF type:complete len:212 (-),score=33.99 TRINITY_DN8879_c0_g1_i1:65-679(-)